MKDDKLPNIGQVTTEIIDGLRIRLSRSGRSDGVPVLLTSPWPESIYAFHRVLPYLVESHPIIAIDLPGFGHSESRADVMSPRGMGVFLIKVAAILFFYVWMRWTLPRYRYDQLMAFGWKILLPLSVINLLVTAAGVLYFGL